MFAVYFLHHSTTLPSIVRYSHPLRIDPQTETSRSQQINLMNLTDSDRVPPAAFFGILNGFEQDGIDRHKIDGGGQVAIHVLFHDPSHLVVTIYFLNQSKAVFLNNRRFETIEQFCELRDEFLNSYSECLKRVAPTPPTDSIRQIVGRE